MTGWHGEQWDFENNEKTMEHSDHWIMTGWHGEQWDFENNEKTMEYFNHWVTVVVLRVLHRNIIQRNTSFSQRENSRQFKWSLLNRRRQDVYASGAAQNNQR